MTRSYGAGRVPRPASHDRSSSTSRESSGTFRAREFEPELHSAHARDINAGIAGIVRLNPLGFCSAVRSFEAVWRAAFEIFSPTQGRCSCGANKAETHESMEIKEREKSLKEKRENRNLYHNSQARSSPARPYHKENRASRASKPHERINYWLNCEQNSEHDKP